MCSKVGQCLRIVILSRVFVALKVIESMKEKEIQFLAWFSILQSTKNLILVFFLLLHILPTSKQCGSIYWALSVIFLLPQYV